MKDKVKIKSFSNGLTLQMDEQAAFEELLFEIKQKFKDGKAFFGDSAVAIAFRGRELSEKEEELIMEAIEENCNLKLVCIVSKDEAQERIFKQALQHMERKKLAEADLGREVQVFRGSLKGGEKLETPNSIIVLGDVESDCSVSSEKNILILGCLYGTALAGQGKDAEDCFVAALEMTPNELYIGDFKYNPGKKPKWGRKKKDTLTVARIQENSILMEELTKETLKDL